MALRLIETILQEKDSEMVSKLLKECHVLEHKQIQLSDSEVLLRILLKAERSEEILDLLQKNLGDFHKHRVIILPVEATLPRIDEKQVDGKLPERIDREELYETIKDAARCSKVYLTMVALSTIVAAVGFYHNSVTLIIGAMVIAPLLGPNMALAFSTTLGDLQLLKRSIRTNLIGIVITIGLSMVIGMWLHIDPTLTEIESRTRIGWGDLAVALASGCAGALAFTTGVSAILIGVMVAVAVLPPLVTFGLLLGDGHLALATDALFLFGMNIISVNLAGVITFLIQGIHPVMWWEKDRASKATYRAIMLWAVLLSILVGILVLIHKS